MWRKKAGERRDSCLTKVMIAALVVMIVIFIFLMSFLDSSKQEHIELEYSDTNFNFIQSTYPHLKFLMRSDIQAED